MHDGATACMSDSSRIHLHLDLNHRCSIFKAELKIQRSPLNAFQKRQLHLPAAGAMNC